MANSSAPGASRAHLPQILRHVQALADLLTGFHAYEERDPGYYALAPDTTRQVAESIADEIAAALALLEGPVDHDPDSAPSLWDLQFIADVDEEDGWWSVTPSADPARDFAEGARFGRDFVAYLGRARRPEGPHAPEDALGHVLVSMAHHPDTTNHMRGFGRALTAAITGRS